MQRDAMNIAALQDALSGRWNRIEVVPETGSTNADLLADANAPDRSVRFAEHQSAGRGRLDRSWESPTGAGLMFSVLLRPTVPLNNWGWLPLLTGVALREAVAAIPSSGADVHLKWPNDLLLGPEEKKLAGILAQSADGRVVIGIGLNVSTTAEELAGLPDATSLAIAGIDADRTQLAIAILTRLDALLAQWEDGRTDPASYRAACSTLGRTVTVTGADGVELRGVAKDFDVDGHLLLEVDGTVLTIAAGDVRHVRPI